jgi:hypothetical protein
MGVKEDTIVYVLPKKSSKRKTSRSPSPVRVFRSTSRTYRSPSPKRKEELKNKEQLSLFVVKI